MLMIARVYLVFIALIFAGVGVASLFVPQVVATKLGLLPQSISGTAEVRSLYGGAFLSWSLIIIGALRYKSSANGMLIALAITMGLISIVRFACVFVDRELAFDAPAVISEALIAVACWVLYRHNKTAAA